MGLANNFLCFYLHFKRGSDPTTLTQDESASMAERQWIFAYSRIEYPRTLSLIVWRRSSTIVMSVTTLLHAYFQFQAAYASQQGLVSLREVAHQPLQMINVSDTFWVTDDHDFSSQHNVPAAEGTNIFGRRLQGAGMAEGPDPLVNCGPMYTNCTSYEGTRLETFPEYTLRMGQVCLTSMVLRAEEKTVIINYAVATCALIAWVCNIAAMTSWYNLKKSRRWILIGWLFTFIAPFIISIVPMRMFVDWSGCNPVREGYFNAFAGHFKLKEKEQMVIRTCEPIINGSTEALVHQSFETLEANVADLIGYHDGAAPCLDENFLNSPLFSDCPLQASCPSTLRNASYFATSPVGASVFATLQGLAESSAVAHKVDFTCPNYLPLSMPLADKKRACTAVTAGDFLEAELQKTQYSIPKVKAGDGAIASLVRYATDAMDWDAEATAAAGLGLDLLDRPTRADINRTVQPGVAGRPLLLQCPQSCGGCGVIGNMIGTSMQSFAMISQVTRASFQVAQDTADTSFVVATSTVDTSFAVTESTVSSSFDATESTVGASYDTLKTGANGVASGVGTACDALDQWAPLIDAASGAVGVAEDVGNFFSSSFRRSLEEEGAQDESDGDVGGDSHRRRLQDVQDECRSTEDSADGLVSDIGSSKTDTMSQIGDARNDVTSSIADTHSDVSGALLGAQSGVNGALLTAEASILQAVQMGRNSMIVSFEMTRDVARRIRGSMGLVQNQTSKVFKYMARGCERLLFLITAPPGDADGALKAVQSLIAKTKLPVELMIGLLHAFLGFKIMVPAAISIAPGLVQGALNVKMLVPQSSLPGVFIVLLPWLYCPIIWCLYNFAFQLVGDWFVLVGLLLLAYAPMINVLIGEWKSVAQPMNDAEVLRVSILIIRSGQLLLALALAAIAVFLYKVRRNASFSLPFLVVPPS